MTASSRQVAAITASALVGAGATALVLRTARLNWLHVMFTCVAVVMWLGAASLYARGDRRIDRNRLVSKVLFALGMSLAALNYCLVPSLQSPWVWASLGLSVLLTLAGAVFRVRAALGGGSAEGPASDEASGRAKPSGAREDDQPPLNLVVMPNRAALSRAAISSFAFVAAGIGFVAFWITQSAGTFGVVVGVFGLSSIALFGLGGIVAIMRLVRPKPVLVIDGRGMTVVGVGFIAWSDIDEMREFRFMTQAFIGIVPRDREALLASQPIWKRLLIRLNRLTGTPPLSIPQSILPMPISDLLRDIRGCRDGESHA